MKNTIVLAFVFCLVACANVVAPLNQPLSHPSAGVLPSKITDDETLLILTFSGGGTRAAALSYGVLKALEQTPTANPLQSLLSEVDVISGVSGGSFTAAYYGLFGEKIFSDYEKDFLKYPMQSKLLNDGLLSPKNWRVLSSDFFNRSDLAADFYDKQLFHGKVFADMRSDMPLVIINATDISTGEPFTFTQSNMQRICSRQGDYLVSRAVAASSAIPAVFSPITLINYGGCPSLEKDVYADKSRYPYLHLLDGGISDNLGIRSVLQLVEEKENELYQLLRNKEGKQIKRVAFIVVDAADEIPKHIAQNPAEPDVIDIVGAVTTLQSQRYNTGTLALLRDKIKLWEAQLNGKPCQSTNARNCQSIPFYLIELNLKQLPKTMADEVTLYETALELPEKQVDTLIYAGQYLLRHSEVYQQFLHHIQ